MKFQMYTSIIKNRTEAKILSHVFSLASFVIFCGEESFCKDSVAFHLISQSCEVNSGFKARGAIPVRVTSAFFFHYFC